MLNVALLLLVTLGLVGCGSMLTFREARNLAAEGRIEESLAKYQEAIKADPGNAEYRSAYLATRERAIYVWLEQGDQARNAGRAAEAEMFYNRVLALSPGNERATAALSQAARDAQHALLLRQAQTAWQKNDADGALASLRTILNENPKHKRASELRRTIEEKRARPPAYPKLAEALRKPLTIEFRDTPIRQVFEVLARTSGLNFVFDRDVRPDLRATIFLRNTTVQDAMGMLLLTNQLEQRVLDGNSVLIYPNTPAKAREYQQLTVRTFFLNSADVKTAANTIRTIVKTRDLVIDEKQNMIVMRDTPEAVRLAERLLTLHDLPEPEVMLEIEILEVKRTRLIELGIRWPSQLTLAPLSTTGGTTVTLNDLRNLASRSIGATIDPLVLNLRKEDSDANLLANPRIRSRSREKARILVGDRVPNITTTATSTGFVSESVTYVDVGLKLEVEPTVYMDDEVAIRISLEVSNIVSQIQTRSGSLAYQIGTRNASSVLRLQDGENQVLAGLINDEDRNAGNKVPGLGDLPIIGRLFGSQRDDRQKTEIVLSITPRIIRNPQRPALQDAEFDGGTEASFRSRGGDGPGMAPPPPFMPGTPPVLSPPATGPGAPSPMTPPPGPGAALPSGAAPSSITDSGVLGAAPSPAVGGSAVSGPSAFSAAGSTTFSWQGPSQATIGSTFTVALAIRPDQPITSVPFSVGYDPKLLAVTTVTEGDFMRQGGAQSAFASRTDAAAGRVFATASRSTPDGASAPGTLATVTLRALAPAPGATVTLVASAPVGVGGRAVNAQTAPPYTVVIAP